MKSDSKEPLKVLFSASEAEPFIKIGGLGDVAGSLPYALQTYFQNSPNLPKLDLRIFIPFHSKIPLDRFQTEKIDSFVIGSIEAPIQTEVFLCNDTNMPVYLIAGNPIPVDSPVYDSNPLIDGKKFAFFSIAVLEFCRRQNWQPDILHVNDWHTALMPFLIRQPHAFNGFYNNARTILGVHNLPFMGGGTQAGLETFEIPSSSDFRLPKWSRYMPLPMGFSTADRIIAVSPGYAQEILTPEFSCGLDGFFFTCTEKVTGILNGLDTTLWNPLTDPVLVANYSKSSLHKKLNNKQEIIARLGMEFNERTPLIIMISRLDQQKGLDFAIQALQNLTERKFQVIILGVGDPLLEDACRAFEDEYPERVRWLHRFDQTLSHQLYAAGDMIVIPSRYEPCGLTQMIAMRYGCIPVARNTGGLRDTITDSNSLNGQTGILFQNATAKECENAIERALNTFIDQSRWEIIQKNAMKLDFSWNNSAAKYAAEYNSLRKSK
ncbi:MAG: glycogen synthase [Leptolinea sp.]